MLWGDMEDPPHQGLYCRIHHCLASWFGRRHNVVPGGGEMSRKLTYVIVAEIAALKKTESGDSPLPGIRGLGRAWAKRNGNDKRRRPRPLLREVSSLLCCNLARNNWCYCLLWDKPACRTILCEYSYLPDSRGGIQTVWRGRKCFRVGSPLSLPGESNQCWVDPAPASHRTPCQQSDKGGEEACVLALFWFPTRVPARWGGGVKLASAWSRCLEITQESNVRSQTSQVLVCAGNPFPPGRLLELMLKSGK